MPLSTWPERERLRTLPREKLQEWQLSRLNHLLEQVAPLNSHLSNRLAGLKVPLQSLYDLSQIPECNKDDLAAEVNPSHLLTYPLDQFVRCHQTSGTRGRPVRVYDTLEDWEWWKHCWQYVLDAAEISSADRAFMAFSFGPFIGFWSAFDALVARHCMVIPGGGMTTLSRLELIKKSEATVLCCTPSYALHMAETATEHHMEPARWKVRKIIVAGEPGGSVPSVREQIESFWHAKVIDHAGASEVGAWGYSDPANQGIYLNEAEFIAEFCSLQTGSPAQEGELSEVILTALGRTGFPVIRYRTGDVARPVWKHGGSSNFVLLQGGLLSRTDDMLIVRGVNIFPSAIEQIVRAFPEVMEYRLIAYRESALDQLKLLVEDRLNQPRRVAEELRVRLGVRIEVECVPLGSLPRFEGKGRRFDDRRHVQP